MDKFDQNLAHSCQQNPDWKTRYYFDSSTRTCKAYWFGGCWSHSRNNFESLETCKWKCIGEHYEPISRMLSYHKQLQYLFNFKIVVWINLIKNILKTVEMVSMKYGTFLITIQKDVNHFTLVVVNHNREIFLLIEPNVSNIAKLFQKIYQVS